MPLNSRQESVDGVDAETSSDSLDLSELRTMEEERRRVSDSVKLGGDSKVLLLARANFPNAFWSVCCVCLVRGGVQ